MVIGAETQPAEQALEKSITTLHESVFWDQDDAGWEEYGLGERLPSIGDENPVELDRDSYIFVFTGRRGAGKSEAMTATAIKSIYLYEMRLIANYPVKVLINYVDGRSRLIEAEPLDLYRLLCFDSDYQNCLILMDEAPDIISHMAAQTWKNRLLNIWVRQLRKNRNSLFCAAQQFEILDKSFRWQTDIICECEDASRKYGNRALRRGEVVLMRLLDQSGLWTGNTWQEEQKRNERLGVWEDVGMETTLYAAPMWGDKEHEAVYNTLETQDVFESLKKVDLKLSTFKVGAEADMNRRSNLVADVVDRIKDLQDAVSNGGKVEIVSTAFWSQFEHATQGDKAYVGELLNKSGSAQRHSGPKTIYDFEKFDSNKMLRVLAEGA